MTTIAAAQERLADHAENLAQGCTQVHPLSESPEDLLPLERPQPCPACRSKRTMAGPFYNRRSWVCLSCGNRPAELGSEVF